MLSVTLLLLLAAFGCNVATAIGKCPQWISVMLIIVWGLLTVLPR